MRHHAGLGAGLAVFWVDSGACTGGSEPLDGLPALLTAVGREGDGRDCKAKRLVRITCWGDTGVDMMGDGLWSRIDGEEEWSAVEGGMLDGARAMVKDDECCAVPGSYFGPVTEYFRHSLPLF